MACFFSEAGLKSSYFCLQFPQDHEFHLCGWGMGLPGFGSMALHLL